MRGPVSVPERKHTVSPLLILCVTICHRCGHSMKQRCVQQPPVSVAGGRDRHAPEIVVPHLVGSFPNGVKIRITHLCVKIGPGSLHTLGRESYLGNKRLGRRGKHTQRKRVISLTSRHRPRKLRMKIYLLISGPSSRIAVAAHGRVTYLLHMSLHRPVPADAVSQIYLHISRVTFVKTIAVYTDMSSGRELYIHSGLLKPHCIIARTGALVFVRKPHLPNRRITCRHKQNITEVTYAGAAEMCVAESEHCRIGIMIARTPVPTC